MVVKRRFVKSGFFGTITAMTTDFSELSLHFLLLLLEYCDICTFILLLTTNFSTGRVGWTKEILRGAKPPYRIHHAGITIGPMFVIFAGFDGQKYRNDLWFYDHASMK